MTETSLVNVSISEEPSAVVPHARICEGTVWATGGSTSILYQITSRTKDKKVTVEERISGKIVLREKSGRVLDSVEIKIRPRKQSEKKVQIKRKYASRDDIHPWKKWIERGYSQNPSYAQRIKKERKATATSSLTKKGHFHFG